MRSLCFDLGVDFDSLPGQGKADKARELVGYLERRNRVGDLLCSVARQRPDILLGGGIERVDDRLKALVSDVLDNDLGIERIWPNRRTWRDDPVDGQQAWLLRVCQANRVEIMSNTLLNFGVRISQFRRDLFAQIGRGASVRILLYEPDSKVQRMRAADEGDVPGEMQQEIRSSLCRFARDRQGLAESDRSSV